MTTKQSIKIWEYIANTWKIALTPEQHFEIENYLADEMEKYADKKIEEMENIMKQLKTPGVR